METQRNFTKERTADGRLVIQVDEVTIIETDTSDWAAASTGVGSIESTEPRLRLRPTPPGLPVPQGQIHAYELGDDITACGVPLDDLHAWDDQPFSDRLMNRCEVCIARIRAD